MTLINLRRSEIREEWRLSACTDGNDLSTKRRETQTQLAAKLFAVYLLDLERSDDISIKL
jgi:hypothetical protein